MRTLLLLLLLSITLSSFLTSIHAYDLYCGEENCYAVLGIEDGLDATPSQIKKAFYTLSLRYHPDKRKDFVNDDGLADVSDEALAERYQQIVTAYEVLGDVQSRATYDRMLRNPHQYVSNMANYYSYRVKHVQVSPWRVLFVLLTLATTGQYFYFNHRHKVIRRQLAQHPLLQQRIRDRVKADMLKENLSLSDKGEIARRVRVEQETNVDAYIQLSGSESRGLHYTELLPFMLIKAPFYLIKNFLWMSKWFIWHGWLSKPYGPEEAEFATSVAVRMSWKKWKAILTEEQRADLVSKQLWIKRNFEEFIQDQKLAAKKKR